MECFIYLYIDRHGIKCIYVANRNQNKSFIYKLYYSYDANTDK